MKHVLLSGAALVLLSGSVFAADIPAMEEPMPSYAPVPAAANWSGVYVGLHGGYGWADADACLEDGPCIELDSDANGAVLGGQVGANFQFNSFVLGAEADASWSGISADDDDGDDGEGVYDYLASARLRAGVAVDRFLAYGTGGLGVTSLDLDGVEDVEDNTEFGWVLGGGAEMLVTDNVTVGAEYLHYDFNDVLEDVDDAEVDTDADVIRARVNVKFGGLFGG